MNLRRQISILLSWWRSIHPSSLNAIPEYREASLSERRAKRSGSTQAIGRARKAKSDALHRALAAGRR